MNGKNARLRSLPYIMQVFTIHKQGELIKINELDSSIVYRIYNDHGPKVCKHLLSRNIGGNKCNHVFYPYACRAPFTLVS